MTAKQLKKFFEDNGFNVLLYKENNKQGTDIEIWTDGGVDMITTLQPFTIKEFVKYVNDFDIDEEIDMYREGKLYRDNFTIRESLEDFETYQEMLKDLVVKLEKL